MSWEAGESWEQVGVSWSELGVSWSEGVSWEGGSLSELVGALKLALTCSGDTKM